MKVLLYDEETAKGYAKVPFYQLKQYSNYINPDYVVRPVTMVCAAWKWLDSPYIASTSVLNDPERFEVCHYDDFHVVKTLIDLVAECDVLIAHNGDNFDWKTLQARCIYHGITPPPKPLMIDTLKVSRKELKLESHSLRYLARYLGVSDKGKSPNWDLVYEGDKEEIKNCEQYCRQDIRTLEGVYYKLLPYIRNHPNFNVHSDGPRDACPSCGSENTVTAKTRKTKSGVRVQKQCKDCASYHTVGKIITKTETR